MVAMTVVSSVAQMAGMRAERTVGKMAEWKAAEQGKTTAVEMAAQKVGLLKYKGKEAKEAKEGEVKYKMIEQE